MKINFKGTPIFIGTGGKKLDPEKKNLIFIHGSGGSHFSWFMQTRYFAYEGYNVISPDFPGHGLSEGNPLVSIEEMSLWLSDLISNLKINDFNLIGHSQGCLIALETSQKLKKSFDMKFDCSGGGEDDSDSDAPDNDDDKNDDEDDGSRRRKSNDDKSQKNEEGDVS